ncbi:MAG TPA: L-seryl-tRNA(Sec) selenium transferase [Thermoanaerobaculia bacterium]|nr:L-seryl-tRNA(Sec) selenium transferase [Thermoanaerobaculia bacterium]
MSDPERRPPSIESLLSHPEGARLVAAYGRARVRDLLRTAAARYRAGEIAAPAGTDAVAAALLSAAGADLRGRAPAGPRPVVNATGVLLHTNLGRAPLAAAALDAARRAGGYCTLEFDPESGRRGRRGEHVRERLRELFVPGREGLDALAVNNAAAALLLALDTVANGRPVAVSRGELVAIGGDFRIPSILARSGASLLEVGTTNRTTAADYREAIDAGAAAILKVRPSNYRIVGFTEEVDLATLSGLARARGVPLIFDAGSGTPVRRAEPALADEPVPADALDAGADLVCFSGDKLLGGPQAGLLVGRADLVGRAAENPLARALRPDKLVLGALAATLDLHLAGRAGEIPLLRMLERSEEELHRRAEALASEARRLGYTAEVVPERSVVGGGAGAESTVPTRAVALAHARVNADDLAASLRRRPVPVVGRIASGRLLLDLRTVEPGEEPEILSALREAGTS